MNRNSYAPAAVVGSALALVSSVSNAAIDAAVSTAISTAQTDALTLAGVMTAMVAVIWGALFLKKKFFG